MATDFLDAVKRGDRATVERMLRQEPALAGARDENGTSALLLAYYHGRPEVADALLAHGPQLDVFEAATAGDGARLRELLDRDPALVDAVAADGFFPVGLAAFFKRADCVRLLLERGANVHARARLGAFTPLHSAVADDPGPVVKDIVEALLDAGADPNAASASGGTPLHTAAFTGDVETVRLLLAAGADPEARDAKGITPLDLARERRNSEAAAVLHHAVTARKRM